MHQRRFAGSADKTGRGKPGGEAARRDAADRWTTRAYAFC
jgi:hypothetical protein